MKNILLLISALLLYNAASFAQINITFSTIPPSCAGPCAGVINAIVSDDASPGSGDTTYLWSNGETTASIRGLCSGNYSVTVTDIGECRANAGSCSATATVTLTNNGKGVPSCSVVSIPQGDISVTGGNPNNIYLGYGPQSTQLSATVSGTTGPLTYAWSPASGLSCTDCANPVFTPTSGGLYTFAFTVTTAGGCTSTCSITICVRDIRAINTSPGNSNGHQNGTGNNNPNKVYVCHRPPGNPANEQTICIDISAVPAHVPGHPYDNLGTCEQTCGDAKSLDGNVPELIADPTGESSFDILVYPNPFNQQFHLQVESASTEPYDIKLYDVTGRLVSEQKEADPSGQVILGNNLVKGMYYAEVRQGSIQRVIRLIKAD